MPKYRPPFLTEQTYRKYRLVENWWRLCWGFFWFCDWSTSTSPGISEFWPSEISLSSRCFIKTSTVDVNPYLTVYGSLLIIYIVCCCKDRWLKRILIYFWYDDALSQSECEPIRERENQPLWTCLLPYNIFLVLSYIQNCQLFLRNRPQNFHQ